jgi:hypothetical protein
MTGKLQRNTGSNARMGIEQTDEIRPGDNTKPTVALSPSLSDAWRIAQQGQFAEKAADSDSCQALRGLTWAENPDLAL